MGPVARKVPTLKPFSRVCTIMPYPRALQRYVPSLSHGVWHESPRPQIHRFRPQALAPLPGVCFLSTARSTLIAHFSSAPARLQAGSAASALQGIEEGHEVSAWHQPAAQNAQDATRLWLGTQR
jgi:hypothetical protein